MAEQEPSVPTGHEWLLLVFWAVIVVLFACYVKWCF